MLRTVFRTSFRLRLEDTIIIMGKLALGATPFALSIRYVYDGMVSGT